MTTIRSRWRSLILAPIRKPVVAWRRKMAPETTAGPLTTLFAARPDLWCVVQEVRAKKLTYLSDLALVDLAEAVTDLDRKNIEGAIVEAGTALGGSAVVLGRAKSADRPLLLHDVFGQIPPPGQMDGEDVHRRYSTITEGGSEGIDGEVYYGYREDLMGEVTATLGAFGLDLDSDRISLVQGLFEDTVPLLVGPIALAHLDGDWYESTKVCLDAMAPLVSVGGRLVIDDYGAWSGCQRATDEFLASDLGKSFQEEQRERLHLVRSW